MPLALDSDLTRVVSCYTQNKRTTAVQSTAVRVYSHIPGTLHRKPESRSAAYHYDYAAVRTGMYQSTSTAFTRNECNQHVMIPERNRHNTYSRSYIGTEI